MVDGRAVFGIAAVIAMSSGVSRAEVPQLYGAAVLREDTAMATMTADYSGSGNGWSPGISLNLLSTALPHAKVLLRTGIDGVPYNRLRLSMQEASLTVPLRATVVQAGFGYQPVRIRETRHMRPAIGSENNTPEKFRLDWYNIDRIRVTANGMTGIGGMRHLVYGAAIVKEWLSGIIYNQTADYEASFDYVEYRQYGKGDGRVAAQAGFGYCRDISFREQSYTFFWLLEGNVSRNHEALRYNEAIVPLLLSYERDNYRYQYNVRATGRRNVEGGGQLHFIFSPRFLPMLPQMLPKSTFPLQVTGAIETVSFCMGAGAADNYHVYVDKSNVFPDGVHYYDLYSNRRGPFTEADHAFRVYATHRAMVNRAALVGRVAYRSSGQGMRQGAERVSSWSGTADLWLGVGSLWYRRVAAEVFWRGLSSHAGWYYYKDQSTKRFDSDVRYAVAPGADVVLNIRMLW